MKPGLFLTTAFALTLCVALAAIAIKHRQQPARATAAGTRVFQVHGQIRSLDAAAKTIRIAHEEIPGYMPAMTMPLTVKEAALFNGLSAGDDVQFELAVTEDDSWVSHIERIVPDGPPTKPVAALQSDSTSTDLLKGEMVPDFKLIDQNGRPIRMSDFRGQAVVLTFIYTRCPLPNFCPLMSKNFVALQQRLSKAFPGRFHLLSVSIDPKFDRPEVLKDYSDRYGADEKCWSFATGDDEQISQVGGLFGLVREPENGLISHNLRTALIGPDGRLVQVWKSNVWTPYEVHRMIGESLTGTRDYAVTR